MNKVVAIVGNPNAGKTSLFNNLTGMNQKIGNFPGVTVEKKEGIMHLPNLKITLIDLPGSYNIYPKSEDERVSLDCILDLYEKIDALILVFDATNFSRNLLYLSQIKDLGIPMMVAISMMDITNKKGINISLETMQRQWQLPIVPVNPRQQKGNEQLKSTLQWILQNPVEHKIKSAFVQIDEQFANSLSKLIPQIQSLYGKILFVTQNHTNKDNPEFEELAKQYNFNISKFQAEETFSRYQYIKEKIDTYYFKPTIEQKRIFADKLDKVFLHKYWGPSILFIVLLLVFQSIYTISQVPMEWIELFFSGTCSWLTSVLPATWWSKLLIQGIWAGLGGIIVFIPQIAIFFGLINVLEDSGYMSRISFLTDGLLRRVGLSGRSAMPLMSGFACAVPAIMATRTIANKKERLITILITPLLSCSARLPVYVILIGLLIPDQHIFGFINLKGLTLFGLYIISILFAIFIAAIFNKFISNSEKNYFILELPIYRKPKLQNIVAVIWQKSKVFLFDAGKIILALSIVLWFLASYGPKHKRQEISKHFTELKSSQNINLDSLENIENGLLLQYSYLGHIGQAIEPAIRPLGFDWKIGIALISSFAAREVFVGTISTIYSLGNNGEEDTIIHKMQNAKFENGQKVFTKATGFALLVFYIFSMQCISTLAIVKKETNSWKWPLIQLFYMSTLAYSLAYLVQVFLR